MWDSSNASEGMAANGLRVDICGRSRDQTTTIKLTTWMFRWKLGSMVRINGLFHLLINEVYWGYNPLNLLLTSWDILAHWLYSFLVQLHYWMCPIQPHESRNSLLLPLDESNARDSIVFHALIRMRSLRSQRSGAPTAQLTELHPPLGRLVGHSRTFVKNQWKLPGYQ